MRRVAAAQRGSCRAKNPMLRCASRRGGRANFNCKPVMMVVESLAPAVCCVGVGRACAECLRQTKKMRAHCSCMRCGHYCNRNFTYLPLVVSASPLHGPDSQRRQGAIENGRRTTAALDTDYIRDSSTMTFIVSCFFLSFLQPVFTAGLARVFLSGRRLGHGEQRIVLLARQVSI